MSFESLVAEAAHYWRCQEIGGALADSNGGVPLIPSGGVSYGQLGPRPWLSRAVRRTGTDVFSSAPVVDLGDTPLLSVCFWHNSFAMAGRILQHSRWFLFGATGLQAEFYRTGSAPVVTSTLVMPLNSWFFFGVAVDGVLDTCRFVVDGSSEVLPYTSPLGGLSRPFELGYSPSAVGSDGDFAGCLIWNRILSAGEFQTVRAGPAAPVPSVIGFRKLRGGGKTRRSGVRW